MVDPRQSSNATSSSSYAPLRGLGGKLHPEYSRSAGTVRHVRRNRLGGLSSSFTFLQLGRDACDGSLRYLVLPFVRRALAAPKESQDQTNMERIVLWLL